MFYAQCVDDDLCEAWGWFVAGFVYPAEVREAGGFSVHVRTSQTYFYKVVVGQAEFERCFIKVEKPSTSATDDGHPYWNCPV